MRKTQQVSETADSRSGGAATVGTGAPLIERLVQLVRRPRKAVAGHDAKGATSTGEGRPDRASNSTPSTIDAGLTRGASLFLGGRR